MTLIIKIFRHFIVDYRRSFLKSQITKSISSILKFFTLSCDQSSSTRKSKICYINEERMTTESSTQTTESFNFRQFTEKERINVIVTRSLNAYFKNNSSLHSKDIQLSNNNEHKFRQNSEKKWTCEEIGFLDLIIEENISIVNVKKHVFYKDVYAFVNKFKNMTIFRESKKLRSIIFQCLRDSTLI